MAKHAGGTGDLVDEVARRSGLTGRQNLAALGFFRITRGPGLLALNLHQRGGDVAQQPDGDLAVEIDVLDKARQMGVSRIDWKPDQRRVPNAPGFTALIELPPGIEGIRFD